MQRASGCFRFSVTPYLIAQPVESRYGDIVGMLPCKRSSFRAEIGCIGAAAITAADWVFDLDDLGPQSGQQQSGERSCQRGGQIEHRHVFQRSILHVEITPDDNSNSLTVWIPTPPF